MTNHYIIAKQSAIQQLQNGILAQLGEHLPYKQRVIGSSPIGPILLQKAEEQRWRDSSVG